MASTIHIECPARRDFIVVFSSNAPSAVEASETLAATTPPYNFGLKKPSYGFFILSCL